jgi:hypothetical protein
VAEREEPIRTVAWRELLPWLLILDSFRLSTQPGKLIVATIGVALTWFGWAAAQMYFQVEPANWISSNDLLEIAFSPVQDRLADTLLMGNPLVATWFLLLAPVVYAVTGSTSWLFALVTCLWTLLVWSFLGGVLGRVSALQLGLEDDGSLTQAMRHAARKWISYITAPLLPGLGIGILMGLIALVGLAFSSFAGQLAGVVLWPIILVLGVALGLLLVGVVVGWPLMWSTISVERTDGFDAFARSFGYVYQRPLRLVFYLALATVQGVIGWAIVSAVILLILVATLWTIAPSAGMTMLSTALSATPEALQSLLDRWGLPTNANDAPPGGLGGWAASITGFWLTGFALLSWGFAVSYFWTSTTAVYLTLRHDVDGTEFDDISVDRTGAARTLPPLAPTSDGPPVVQLTPKAKKTPEGDASSEPASPEEPPADATA